MNTILIAEDEKFIRMGLKAMAQRAPIPVGEILEARDGEEALALLRTHTVDLLITDIRMPKMDGIQLVEQLPSLTKPPMVLVISGYDDFNYAVAMLRSGAQEYLLKPVERQQFYDSLSALEAKLQARQAAEAGRSEARLQALRRLMLEADDHSPEYQELETRYRANFLSGSYVGLFSRSEPAELPPEVLRIHAVADTALYVTPVEMEPQMAALLPPPVGCSDTVQGLSSLHACYTQARSAWKRSFFTERPCRAPVEVGSRTPSVTVQQLLSLVSLSRDKEVSRLLGVQAKLAAQGDLPPDSFADLCTGLIQGLCQSYRNLLESEEDAVRLARPWDFPSAPVYLEAMDQWLGRLCARIAQEFADYENKQKIRTAVQYIQAHFREPLNMAVVSNHVSMNYSLFSLLFKQYTGTNFVSYLQNLRLAESRRLLESTDWRVNEICRRSGFTDEKHFLKVFKSAVGLSPTEYRKSRILLEQKEP